MFRLVNHILFVVCGSKLKTKLLKFQLMLSFYLMSPEELKDSKVTSFDDSNMKKAWILNFIQSIHLETFNMRTNFFRYFYTDFVLIKIITSILFLTDKCKDTLYAQIKKKIIGLDLI